jgi:hypothetical protein
LSVYIGAPSEVPDLLKGLRLARRSRRHIGELMEIAHRNLPPTGFAREVFQIMQTEESPSSLALCVIPNACRLADHNAVAMRVGDHRGYRLADPSTNGVARDMVLLRGPRRSRASEVRWLADVFKAVAKSKLYDELGEWIFREKASHPFFRRYVQMGEEGLVLSERLSEPYVEGQATLAADHFLSALTGEGESGESSERMLRRLKSHPSVAQELDELQVSAGDLVPSLQAFRRIILRSLSPDGPFELDPKALTPRPPGWELNENALSLTYHFVGSQTKGLSAIGRAKTPPPGAPEPLVRKLSDLGGSFLIPTEKGMPLLWTSSKGVPLVNFALVQDEPTAYTAHELLLVWASYRDHLIRRGPPKGWKIDRFEGAVVLQPYQLARAYELGLRRWLNRRPEYLSNLKRKFLGPKASGFDETLAHARRIGRGLCEATRWAMRLWLQQQQMGIIFLSSDEVFEDPVQSPLTFYSQAVRTLFQEVLSRSQSRVEDAIVEANVSGDRDLARALRDELEKFRGVDLVQEIWKSLNPDGFSTPDYEEWKQTLEEFAPSF